MKEEITPESKPIKTPFYYGWIVLGIAALGLMFSGPGQTYSISIFIDHYIEQFDWSRSLISGLYSTATLTSGLILIMVGKNIDKFGQRKMISIISAVFGLACFWMSFVFHPAMLFTGFILLRLLGQGSMTLIPHTLVPQWFEQKRGLALSIMGIGGVTGASLLPPLNNWLINTLGLNFTWRFWGFLLIFFMAPLGWFFVRNKPENIGLRPDGEDGDSKERKDSRDKLPHRVHISKDPWTLKQAMSTRAFWCMIYCTIVPALVATGLTFHIVSIIKGKGYSSAFAALVLSVSAMVRFPLTFVAGFLLDRLKVHIVKGVNYSLFAGALFLMLRAGSKFALIIFALIYGVFFAFDRVSTGVLWPNYFGRKHLGTIRGFTMTAVVIGSSLGPLPFGLAYDIFGGYREVLMIMIILPVLAVIASLLSPPPEYDESSGL